MLQILGWFGNASQPKIYNICPLPIELTLIL